MSAHVRDVRFSRSSNLLLAAAFAVVVFAFFGILWIARLGPAVPRSPTASEGTSIPAAPSRTGTPQCLACGTVIIIRTFELQDAPRRLVYRVTLQMDDGSFRTFSQSTQPPFPLGARVRVLNGAIAGRT